MSAKSEFASSRPRCPDGCGSFLHTGKPCPKRGGSKPKLTPEERVRRERERVHRWQSANREVVRAAAKRDRETLRREAVQAYGGKCACCGEAEPVFLCLDHLNNDGADDRKTNGERGGTQTYRRLRRLGWPEGWQVLCWNCNSAKHILGACPHALTR